MIMLRNRRAAVTAYERQMQAKYGPNWNRLMMRSELRVLNNRRRVLTAAESALYAVYRAADAERNAEDKAYFAKLQFSN